MKNQLLEIYQSRRFQIMMDVCRVLMFVIAIAILIKLTTEIEAVKMLRYDPCRLCENKTGAVCFFTNESGTVIIKEYVYPKINWSNTKIGENGEKEKENQET